MGFVGLCLLCASRNKFISGSDGYLDQWVLQVYNVLFVTVFCNSFCWFVNKVLLLAGWELRSEKVALEDGVA